MFFAYPLFVWRNAESSMRFPRLQDADLPYAAGRGGDTSSEVGVRHVGGWRSALRSDQSAGVVDF
jgi:hypothetical protein